MDTGFQGNFTGYEIGVISRVLEGVIRTELHEYLDQGVIGTVIGDSRGYLPGCNWALTEGVEIVGAIQHSINTAYFLIFHKTGGWASCSRRSKTGFYGMGKIFSFRAFFV